MALVFAFSSFRLINKEMYLWFSYELNTFVDIKTGTHQEVSCDWSIYFTVFHMIKRSKHSQKYYVICSFTYIRWRHQDICMFQVIYIADIISNCMHANFLNCK